MSLRPSWPLGLALCLCACNAAVVSEPSKEEPDGGIAAGDEDDDSDEDDTDDDDDVEEVPVPAGCGDGVLAEVGEACDDGNGAAADGCSRSCQVEAGWNCPPTGACAARCGDGQLVGAESCDDGNNASNDGCSATCSLENGWLCLVPGGGCEAATCGDGTVAGLEACDDHNDAPGDGCDVSCKVESGWTCPAAGESCVALDCGDGIRAGDEACDDGNEASGDGCTAACDAVEPNHGCPPEGGACFRTTECGNGIVTSDEECDDRNVRSGDGCSAGCTREPGYACPLAGAACRAAECGDGIVVGREECEDGNDDADDGCDGCRVTPGHACTATSASPPSSCHPTECNDGIREGDEACDDGNTRLGDGCTPFCAVEPSCSDGPCRSACGDGIKLALDAEECDDGNTRPGDGCDAACRLEEGYACVDVETALPATFELPVVFRDFIRAGKNGTTRHPDFERFSGNDASEGLVKSALSNGVPEYTGLCQEGGPNIGNTARCPYGAQTTSKANFDQWYGENASVMKKKVTRITMVRVPGSDAYRNQSFGAQLFPLDGAGWVASNQEEPSAGHNFSFTSEIRHYFAFKGGEKLTFSGDDDVWVFVGGKLALDLGGLHPKKGRTIVLDAATGRARCFLDEAASQPCATASRDLGLVKNEVYEMALFHAERHTGASNFDLTLTGFISTRTECESQCGDGVVTPDEVCDDGSALNDGGYGRCTAQCDGFGPYCGDGVPQSVEACDDGSQANVGGYDGCTQACQLGPRCGDGSVDGYHGEQCDKGDGHNTGSYGGCTDDCELGPRCGDGVVQAAQGEVCDDRVNRSAYGGCAPGCVLAPSCGDGKVQSAHGEECDAGKAQNQGGYGGCTSQCKLSPRCGDGVRDEAREECDDGNLNAYDGCSPRCVLEGPL